MYTGINICTIIDIMTSITLLYNAIYIMASIMLHYNIIIYDFHYIIM